jgi:hypothetical protein
MKQLEGFVVKGKKELVCNLNKSLYGLNQSPRMWYQNFDTCIIGLGFVLLTSLWEWRLKEIVQTGNSG